QTGSSPLNNSSGQTLRLMPASWALKRSSTHLNFVPTVATGNLSVLGSGTVGRLAKWTGMTSSNAIIGDTAIFENKNGLVGIGTDTPSSKLTVAGMVEITLGGLKFPDGTVQMTALSADDVVHTLNGLKGNVLLAAGTNIAITPVGSQLTIAAPNVLTG